MTGGDDRTLIKVPAGRTVRLFTRNPERDKGRHDVKVPWWRPGAWRAEFGRECTLRGAGGPALRRIELSQSLQRCLVGHLRCAALDDQVEAGERHGERAARIRGQVPALLRTGAAGE